MAKPTRCPRCSRENDATLASCPGCGEALRPRATAATACPGCGAALLPEFRFCGICGRPVAPAAGAPSAPGRPSAPPLRGAPALRVTRTRSDGATGESHPVEDELLCGRSEGALRLAEDPTVSPRHARFSRSGETLGVEDLGTMNGTFVRLREPRRISLGEEFRVGRQLLRLEALAPRPELAGDAGGRAWGTPDPGFRLRVAQLLEDGGTGDVFPLGEGESLVGREAGELTFPTDRYVSARHARLEVRGGAVTLADAGSSNGTFVRVLGRVELSPGDQLLVGRQLLRIDR
jgi:pSer/pThr/pTyr-binding forkhead associated (FHA) protein